MHKVKVANSNGAARSEIAHLSSELARLIGLHNEIDRKSATSSNQEQDLHLADGRQRAAFFDAVFYELDDVMDDLRSEIARRDPSDLDDIISLFVVFCSRVSECLDSDPLDEARGTARLRALRRIRTNITRGLRRLSPNHPLLQADFFISITAPTFEEDLDTAQATLKDIAEPSPREAA